jgi:glycosyltransferase involved in cell wall biosynthesis
MRQKRALVLAVELSGINSFLFSGLKRKGWELTIVNVPFPRLLRWWALISTFRPKMALWKQRFDERLNRLHKTPLVFKQRTKYCSRKIRKLNGQYDIIFQISGAFSPYLDYRKMKVPYVTFNDYTMALSKKYEPWMPPSSQYNRWFELEKKLYENSECVFVSNENARQSLIRDYGLGAEKVIKSGCGLTLEDYPDYEKKYDVKTILFIGMDFKRKGGFVLLEAFRKVRQVIPDARLIILGPNKDILEIKEPGVEFLGCTRDRTVVEDLYKQASLFVMPSLCEPFGLVFLEAMSHKLPCIGTNIDAVKEIIEDQKTGFLIPPEDSEALAARIIKLLSSPGLAKRLGLAGFKKVKEEFQWEKVAEKIDAEISRQLNRN